VGKSTVGWEVYAQLTGAAFVDIDQLGMCYPESPADPGRYRLAARNLRAVLANFQAAGAEDVVVSGVVDVARAVHREEIPPGAVTLCRLSASRAELVRRLDRRGAPAEVVEEALLAADSHDTSAVADLVVDTTGLSVAEVARRVRELMRPTTPIAPLPVSAEGGPILWVCGPTGVGKSTVGFRVYERILGTGRTAAYVDARQIGFHDPADVTALNLAALWQNFRAAGAETMVVVGSLAALETCALDVTPLRLHAGAAKLAERIMLRGAGQGWPEPGDALKGQPADHLRRVVERAVAEAEVLERAGTVPRFDTDGLTPDEIADAIFTKWDSGWHEQIRPGDSRKYRPLRGRPT
jgi:broad-specificity NMP kinase